MLCTLYEDDTLMGNMSTTHLWENIYLEDSRQDVMDFISLTTNHNKNQNKNLNIYKVRKTDLHPNIEQLKTK